MHFHGPLHPAGVRIQRTRETVNDAVTSCNQRAVVAQGGWLEAQVALTSELSLLVPLALLVSSLALRLFNYTIRLIGNIHAPSAGFFGAPNCCYQFRSCGKGWCCGLQPPPSLKKCLPCSRLSLKCFPGRQVSDGKVVQVLSYWLWRSAWCQATGARSQPVLSVTLQQSSHHDILYVCQRKSVSPCLWQTPLKAASQSSPGLKPASPQVHFRTVCARGRHL